MNIFYLSFGKDSMAQLIIAKQLNIPIDKVIYTEIMYDDNMSAEMPLMVDFINKAEKILKEKFNITVEHIKSIPFKTQFYKVKQKGNHVGDNYGFPYVAGAWCNDRLKVGTMNKVSKQISRLQNVTEFVGIAYDESERYKRLCNKNKRSLLYEQKITEQRALKLCEEYGLLSPIYNSTFRGGCWFCPKQSMYQCYLLWKNYPNLWNELRTLQKDSFNTFKPNCSIFGFEKRFENGYIPKQRKRKD